MKTVFGILAASLLVGNVSFGALPAYYQRLSEIKVVTDSPLLQTVIRDGFKKGGSGVIDGIHFLASKGGFLFVAVNTGKCVVNVHLKDISKPGIAGPTIYEVSRVDAASCTP